MTQSPQIRLDWEAGPSAQVELFSPEMGDGAAYQLKYTSPFHPTIRPPLEGRPLGPDELAPLNDDLDRLIRRLEKNGRRRSGEGEGEEDGGAGAVEDLIWMGRQLLELLIPPYIQTDLRAGGLFLEIGMDEELLAYPWELMHDGSEFLALKHAMGRFVNAGRGVLAPQGQLPNVSGATLEKLAVLVISVPNPEGSEYEHLPEVDAETQALVETLQGSGWAEVTLLRGKKATYNSVFRALSTGKYHIIHYSGHAHFDDQHPKSSALVLQNRPMTTGQIQTFFGRSPAILCFINGCESARSSATWKQRHDVFGLARAFLETGSYFLGSRWKLPDTAAASFAGRFYTSLIGERKAIGEAIREARLTCRRDEPTGSCAWASYVYYGDPRLCFRGVPGPARLPQSLSENKE